jgi:hypothetical protein
MANTPAEAQQGDASLDFAPFVRQVLDALEAIHLKYLAGGTALAEYYLGHRLSLVLGFFPAESPLILPQS